MTVLEAKKHLGGRAHSFRDRITGATIDNSQHVLLGCCEAARSFLAKIGSIGRVDFREEIRFVGVGGEQLRVRSSLLPAPVHLLPSMMRTRYFTADEKLELGKIIVRIARRAPTRGENARDYLKGLSCPQALIERLIDPILVSALNEDATLASADYARMVINKSLLESRTGYQLGVPDVPLSQLIEGPATRYLTRRGCRICTSTKVEKFNLLIDKVESATISGGAQIRPKYYVCAVPPWSLSDMGFSTSADERLYWHSTLGVHLFYEDADLDFGEACVVGEPFGWVFNKTADFGLDFGYVQAVASAADDLVCLPKGELIKLAERAIGKVMCESKRPVLKRAVIYSARRATFSTGSSNDRLRPSSATSVRNLFLAGDWTDTRWPATIEGAVRSGVEAARSISDLVLM